MLSLSSLVHVVRVSLTSVIILRILFLLEIRVQFNDSRREVRLSRVNVNESTATPVVKKSTRTFKCI